MRASLEEKVITARKQESIEGECKVVEEDDEEMPAKVNAGDESPFAPASREAPSDPDDWML